MLNLKILCVWWNDKLTICKLVVTVFMPVQIKCYDFMEEIIVLYIQGKDCVSELINDFFECKENKNNL